MNKKWYMSKTIWANGLFAIAVGVQTVTGTDWVNPAVQGALLVVINLILRAVTKSQLEW